MATLNPVYHDLIRKQSEMVKHLDAVTARLSDEFERGDVEAFDDTCNEAERVCEEIGEISKKTTAMLEDYKRQLVAEEAERASKPSED